jgi:ABC-type transporter Mla subunit MlaD
MAFDPDAYLKKKQEEFNPDRYLASKQTSEEDVPGSIASTLTGAGQGLTAGFGDELLGAIQNPVGAMQAASNLLGANIQSPSVSDYEQKRDAVRKYIESAESAHPYLTTAGKIAGSLIPAGAVAKGVGALGILPELASGAGLGARMALGAGEGALTGAGYGAVENVGEADKNLASAAGQGALLGGATGGVLGATLPVAGKMAKGVHNFAKENISTYAELADILGKEATGTKILGEPAQTANYENLVAQGEPVVNELKNLGGKFGKQQTLAASTLPELNIAPEVAEMQQGIKSKFGVSKLTPAENKVPEVAKKLEDVNSQLKEVSDTVNDRLSENTKKLQEKLKQLQDLKQAKNDAMAKAMLSEDEKSLASFDSIAKHVDSVNNEASTIQQDITKINEVNSKKIESLAAKKSTLENELQEAQKVAAQPPVENTTYNPEFSGDINKLQGRMEFLAQKYGGLENLSPEAQLEINDMLKGISPLEGGLAQPVQNFSEDLRKVLSEKMKDASPEYSQAVSNTSKALTARDLALKNPSKEFGAEAIKSADEYANRVYKAAKGEGGITSDAITRQNKEAQQLLSGLGETELASKMQALETPARNYELSTLTNKGNVYNPLTLARKGIALVGRGTNVVNTPLIANTALKDVLANPSQLKNIAPHIQSPTLKSLVSKIAESEDEGKKKAIMNIILNSPALRTSLKNTLGIKDGTKK